jgi:histidyl-tRNA synthetase
VVSDIGFFVAAAKDPRVSEGLSQQIRRSAGDPERLAALLGRLAGDGATLASHVATTTEAGSEVEREATLDELVAQLPASLRGDLLDVVLGATDHSSSGIRTADEIAQRLLSRAARRPVEALDPAVSHVFAELLGIDLPVTEGLALIRALATESENDALHELCDSWDRRVRLFEAHGIDSAQVLLRPRLRRGIDYYSSFIFEIHDRSGSKVSQICAGGRYDDLVGKLSGREDVPAVGFALGLERLARRVPRSPTVPLVDAVVVGGGDVPQEACVEVTTALRAAGFRAQLLTGHRVRYALRSALRDGIRFLVLVGEEEQANGKVSLRDLDRKTQIEVSVDDLLTHLQSELDRG